MKIATRRRAPNTVWLGPALVIGLANLSSGCGGASGGATTAPDTELMSVIDRGGARQLAPSGPSAEVYQSEPAARRTAPAVDDPLRAQIFYSVSKGAAASGVTIVADARLDAAMNDLARSLRENEQPRSEAVEFLLSHYGVVEPYPVLRVMRAPREAQAQLIAGLLSTFSLPTRDKVVSMGIGIDRSTSELSLIVAVQPKLLDLTAVPRSVAGGGSVDFGGRLLGVYQSPRIYVTDPSGKPHDYPIALRGAEFRARFACDRGDGRYQLEVFGDGEQGPEVMANFPVFCGAEPPPELDGAAGYIAEKVEPATAEAELIALINAERRTAGLSPVEADPEFARVARAHSEDMRANDFVAHLSPRTGGPMDRVEAAGLSARRVLENIGRAGSVEEVHQGLMRSPGHRKAILDGQATRVGVGVVVDVKPTGEITLFATELFR